MIKRGDGSDVRSEIILGTDVFQPTGGRPRETLL